MTEEDLKGTPSGFDASRELVALSASVVAAGLLVLLTLDHHGFWFDEIQSAMDAGKPFSAMVRSRLESGHPPAFSALLWLVRVAAGEGEAVLRLPAALFMLATGPVTYALLRPSTTRVVATIGATTVLFAPFLIVLGQQARAYTLVMLLALLSSLVIARAERDRSRGVKAETPFRVVIFSLLTAANLFTHFAAGLVVGVQAAYLLLRRRPFWRLAVAAALAALSLLVFVQVHPATFDSQARLGWLEQMRDQPPGALMGRLWIFRSNWPAADPWMLPLSAVTLLFAALGARRAALAGRQLLVLALGPPAVALCLGLLGWHQVLKAARYFAPSLASIAALVGVGLASELKLKGPRRSVATVVLLALVAISIQQTTWYFRVGRYPDWRQAARIIQGQRTASERVALSDASRPVAFRSLGWYLREPIWEVERPQTEPRTLVMWGRRQRPVPPPERWLTAPGVSGVWLFAPEHDASNVEKAPAVRMLREEFPLFESHQTRRGVLVHLRRAAEPGAEGAS